MAAGWNTLDIRHVNVDAHSGAPVLTRLSMVATHSQNVSKEIAIENIDYTVQQLEAYALRMKRQRNALVSIGRLPPEVLSRVFSFVREHSLKTATNESKLKWLRVTQVSQHWRDVAIASPTLWTQIDNPIILYRSWLEKFLERSRGAFLSIYAEINPSKQASAFGLGFQQALQHEDRVQRISVVASPAGWQGVLNRKDLDKPLRELEVISLTCPDGDPARFGMERLISRFPKLRYIALKNVFVDWTLPHVFNLHTLTHLKLCAFKEYARPTWNQFLDALRAMPHLEILDLQNAMPLGEHIQQIARQYLVRLNSLRTLLVSSATTSEVGSLLSCIVIPPETNISIKSHDHSFLDLKGSLFASLSNPTASSSLQTLILYSPPIREVGLNDTGVVIKLYAELLSAEDMFMHQSLVPRLELTLYWKLHPVNPTSRGAPSEVDAVMHMIADSLNLDRIQCLYLISIPPKLSAYMLGDTIGKLPNVTFLMAGSWCETLITALEQRRSTGVSKHGRSAVSFPKLSSLYLHGYICQQGSPEYRNFKFEDSDMMAVPIFKLCECLRKRSEAGKELLTLTLKAYPKLVQSDVDKLRCIVRDSIKWTDKETFFPTLRSRCSLLSSTDR